MGLGLWAGTHCAAAQGFIRQFDLEQNGWPGLAKSVREVPGGYLLLCEQVSNDGTNTTHLFARLLDGSGAQLNEREFFVGVPKHYVTGPIDPFATCSDGTIAAAIDDVDSSFDMGIGLFIFGLDGDTLSTHGILRFPPLDSVVLVGRQIRQCTDNGFYVVGAVEPFVPESALGRALLMRTDPVGDTLWTALYGSDPTAEYEALNVAEYVDGGAVVFGTRLRSFVLDDFFVMRTDLQGGEGWTRYFGNKAAAGPGAVRLDDSGQIITWSPYREANFPTYAWAQFMLTKWSPDGDIVWQKKSHYGNDYWVGDMEVLPDNSIVALGGHNYDALLMKFNSDGDSLWTRAYRPFANGYYQHLRDVQPTSDGGFVACGSTQQDDTDPHPLLQTEWVLKTDSLGCVVPGCQNVGVQEYALDLNELLRIAPNPVHDVLSAELPLPPGAVLQGAVRAVLLDAQGRQVAAWPMARSGDELRSSEDISALPSGAYYLHIADEKRWLAGGKVVVQ